MVPSGSTDEPAKLTAVPEVTETEVEAGVLMVAIGSWLVGVGGVHACVLHDCDVVGLVRLQSESATVVVVLGVTDVVVLVQVTVRV